MKRTLYPLAFVLMCFPVRAASLEGEVTLNFASSPAGGNVFKREFGDVVKASCHWYAGRFFDEETVFAGISVTNTGTNRMFFHYSVAFFDKDKRLVGAVSQGSFRDKGLNAGEKAEMSSCLIPLPSGRYKDIVSYQAIIYEKDAGPGKPNPPR